MGISDDIVPRRQHYSHSHPYHEPEEETSKPSGSIGGEIKEEINLKNNSRPDSGARDNIDDDFFKTTPIAPKKPKKDKTKRKSKAWGWIVVFLILALFGFLIFKNYQSLKKLFLDKVTKTDVANLDETAEKVETYASEIKPQDYTSETAAEPVAEENTGSTGTGNSATAAKASLKIQVLNGNGVTNSASVVKNTLETAGFRVLNTANAKNFAYEKTFIYYKTGKEENAKQVEAALTDKVIALDESDEVTKTYDIVVIVGKK